MPKRKRGTVKKYQSSGATNKMRRRVMKRGITSRALTQLSQRVTQITRSIETKEGQWTSASNIGLAHNNITLILKGNGAALNPFERTNGAQDPMDQNQFQNVGDLINVRGMSIKGFFEGALQRSKVYFRVMLVKFARGDTPTRATLFKNDSDNKMLDVINTERYTVVWQKIFTVSPPNPPPNTVSATGVAEPGVLAGVTGSRIIKAWIPGSKFGRGGNVKYESQHPANVKFFDYRFYILAYDWYGTPQDVNNVGRVNSMFSKVYFKDA